MGISDFPPYKLVFLAEEMGYFQAAGVRVRLVEFSQLSDARKAYELGHIDGMATTLVEVLIARSHLETRKPRVTRVINYSEGADAIVASAAIRSLEQMAGRRVGVEPGSVGFFLLGRALERANLKLGDCHIVPLAQPAMMRALEHGRIDAAVTYVPFLDPAREMPGMTVLFSSKDLPGEIVDVFAFAPEILDSGRGEVGAFLTAFDRALEFYRREPDAACAAIARRGGGVADEIRSQMENGIRLVDTSWQSAFFGPSGAGRRTLAVTADVLRQSNLIGDQVDEAGVLDPR